MITLKHRAVGITSLAFSPDGATLVAACSRGLVQLWDLAQSRLEAELRTGHFQIEYAAFAGKALIVLQEGRVHLIDRATGRRRVQVPPRSRRAVSAAAVAADGRVALGFPWAVALFDLPAGGPRVWEHAVSSHTVASLSFSADGQSLATGLGSGRVIVHDTASGSRRHEIPANTPATARAVALSPDGSRAAVCRGPTLTLHEVVGGPAVAEHSLGRTHFLGVAWHPSGGFFATANGDGKVDYWEAATGQRRESFDWNVGKLHDVTFDPAGDRAACCSKTGEIVVWDVDR